MSNTPQWIEAHRRVWQDKPAMRHWHTREIFGRMASETVEGPSLEIGSGPGFLGSSLKVDVATDITPHDSVTVCADAHVLPFADNTFGNVLGVDVLHHLSKPAIALKEAHRVLRPGGRLILVEPWSGFFGTLFFKLVHHEDCQIVDRPWEQAFDDSKAALDGNTRLPKLLLVDQSDEFEKYVPGMTIVHTETFGALSCLLTGGFQGWSFPAPVIDGLSVLENKLPQGLLSLISVRVLFVIEKTLSPDA